MLDTNIVSEVVRRPAGRTAERTRGVAVSAVGVSAIVAAELRYGVRRNSAFKLGDRIEALLTRYGVIAFDEAAAGHYGRLRADLAAEGAALDGNDLLIAAHALAAECVLVTADQAFTRVAGLVVENWLD
jgi:tRNA(fMet)-specific endonuclease VapC